MKLGYLFGGHPDVESNGEAIGQRGFPVGLTVQMKVVQLTVSLARLASGD